jgi:hypothetical protein
MLCDKLIFGLKCFIEPVYMSMLTSVVHECVQHIHFLVESYFVKLLITVM